MPRCSRAVAAAVPPMPPPTTATRSGVVRIERSLSGARRSLPSPCRLHQADGRRVCDMPALPLAWSTAAGPARAPLVDGKRNARDPGPLQMLQDLETAFTLAILRGGIGPMRGRYGQRLLGPFARPAAVGQSARKRQLAAHANGLHA